MATYKYVVDLEWPGSGSPGVNVFHIRTTNDGPLNDDLQGMVDALATFYGALTNRFPVGAVIRGRDEAIKDPYGAPEYEATEGFTVQGSGTGGFLPLATQLVVGWRTTSATRSGRGRTFLGPLDSSCREADGTVAGGVLTQVRDAASALVSASEGFENGAIMIYSPTQSQGRDITGASVRDTFAVLRSRRD